MSKKSAKERLFEALADGQVEIIDHSFREEVSEVSHNEYFLGDQTSEAVDKAKEEYTKLLERLYTEFKDTADEEMVQASNSDLYLRNLKKKLEEVKKRFDSNRQEVQARIEKHRNRVPEEKVAFLNSMANIQSGYIGKTIQYVEEAIETLHLDTTAVNSGADLKLVFNLPQNKVAALFLLMEKAGWLSGVTKKDIKRFIEKHVMWTQKGLAKQMPDPGSLFSKINNNNHVLPEDVDSLKEKFARADIFDHKKEQPYKPKK